MTEKHSSLPASVRRARRGLKVLLGLLIVSLFSGAAMAGQFGESDRYQRLTVRPGLGFEYFSRTITWDEDQSASDLKASALTFQIDFAIEGGFTLSTFGGLTFSSYDGLVFNNLPLTLALDVGRIQGLFIGGDLRRALFRLAAFEISGWGQFVYSHGKTQEWIIPGLNVEGTATGRPIWFRGAVGPEVRYLGLDHVYLYPYLSMAFNKLWGTFEMEQEIQDLKGLEELKYKSRGNVNIRLGTDYDLTDHIRLNGEFSIFPHSEKIDMGFLFKTRISF